MTAIIRAGCAIEHYEEVEDRSSDREQFTRMNNIPLRPAHPERVCWGCDKYCPADDLACGNGTIRTAHPCELFGDDWLEWSEARQPIASPVCIATNSAGLPEGD